MVGGPGTGYPSSLLSHILLGPGGRNRGIGRGFRRRIDRNRRLLATAIAAFDSLESDAKDSNIRQTMVWLLGENAT